MGEYLLTLLNLLLLTHLSTAFCDLGRFFSEKELSIEETARMFPIVFRGISLATTGSRSDAFGDGVQFTARFELLNMFKDAPDLRNHWSIDADSGNRKLDVTLEQLPEECKNGVTGPIEYIVFSTLDDNKIVAKSITKWDEESDQRIWMSLGWSKWSEWSPCSVSCSSGIQQRIRHCSTGKCPGYNIEQRHCNLFG
ncbi:hypothetical protein WA026_018799 [Henosepilachna vigintioctopunctata]|uniref:Uncharacterized protein n=1 Tax=Henosepilachna vigintioctopunctata TaxID=420089 RepID=A0AAW1TQP6_9CUCU